jgi:hypothetical protein
MSLDFVTAEHANEIQLGHRLHTFRHYREIHAVGETHNALNHRQGAFRFLKAAQERLVDLQRVYWKLVQIAQG